MDALHLEFIDEGCDGRFTIRTDVECRSFTSRDLAVATGQSLYLAQKITYCLRKMGMIASAGKRGGALLYTLPNS